MFYVNFTSYILTNRLIDSKYLNIIHSTLKKAYIKCWHKNTDTKYMYFEVTKL